jgi:hypothetical protein
MKTSIALLFVLCVTAGHSLAAGPEIEFVLVKAAVSKWAIHLETESGWKNRNMRSV